MTQPTETNKVVTENYPNLEGLFGDIDDKVIERKSGLSNFKDVKEAIDIKRNTFLNFEDPS